MPGTIRPRRSVLYMPGSNTRALEKGRSLPADALILDLEDAVAPDAKKLARKQVVEAVKAGGYGKRELVIRVNALATPWGYDDLATVATASADAILLPKVESGDMVHQAELVMADRGAPADMAIWCMIETPLGVLHAEQIANASQRVGAFVMATSDLAKDLHCLHTPNRLPFISSLNLCVLVARAYGLSILDGVHLDLSDDDGFAASCMQGKELGFDGKTLIHPKTIAEANDVFGPPEEEIGWSRRIISAYEKAMAERQGVAVVDGRLIEYLHVENARRLVGMAEMIAELEAAAAD